MNDPRIEAAAEEARKIAMEEEGIHVSPWRLSVAQEAYRKDARRILAAVDKAATITTVEELDALPVGAVILDGDPAVLEMKEKSSIYGSTWWMAGSDYEYASGEITLPARVLHWGTE